MTEAGRKGPQPERRASEARPEASARGGGAPRALREGSLVALGGAVSMALILFAATSFSWESLGMALFLIVVWTPVKGIVYRRLGGRNPYRSALFANASSELCGLPFSFALGFWLVMGVSFALSAAIETVALLGLATAGAVKRTLAMAVYGSAVVHLITAGFFASQRSLALGVPFLVLGALLIHLPAMVDIPEEN